MTHLNLTSSGPVPLKDGLVEAFLLEYGICWSMKRKRLLGFARRFRPRYALARGTRPITFDLLA
jgi:hypothetical protein